MSHRKHSKAEQDLSLSSKEKEDKKGSGGKANRTKYKRTYTWNERNQLVSSVDANYNTAYVYGQDGQRSNKYTQNSETLYFNGIIPSYAINSIIFYIFCTFSLD